MNKHACTYGLITFLLCTLVCYLGGAFAYVSFNFTAWPAASREALACVWAPVSGVVSLLAFGAAMSDDHA